MSTLLQLFRRVPRIPAVSASTERRFLLEALELSSATDLDRWTRSVMDWQEVLDIARRFAVSPVVGALMSRPSLRRRVPERVAEALRADYEGAAIQNRLLVRDLRQTAAALDAAGVPYVALKGAALITHHYDDPARRHLDDIDLLVREDDLDAVAAALGAAGYELDTTDYNRARHPLCMDSPSGTKVEVHIQLARGDTTMVWSRAETIDIDGQPVRIASATDLLYHLCHHVIVQHVEDPRFLPRHMVDLDALLGSVADYDPAEPSVRTSLELHGLLSRRRRSEVRTRMLSLLLFPSHHSLAPTGVSRTVSDGVAGKGVRVPSVRGVMKKIFFEIE